MVDRLKQKPEKNFSVKSANSFFRHPQLSHLLNATPLTPKQKQKQKTKNKNKKIEFCFLGIS
jgi:hypothetical protein